MAGFGVSAFLFTVAIYPHGSLAAVLSGEKDSVVRREPQFVQLASPGAAADSIWAQKVKVDSHGEMLQIGERERKASLKSSSAASISTASTSTSESTTSSACKVDDLHWVANTPSTAQLAPLPGKTCTWKRFSRSEAKALLDGRRVLFVGDSVVIYQYLAMAMFLHDGMSIEWDGPNMWMLQETAGDYNQYAAESSSQFRGHEFCDCDREACHPFCSPQSFVGNRHYRFGNQAFISVVPALGDIVPPRGHTSDLVNWKFNCASVPCSAPADWEEPAGCYVNILKNVVDRYKPDILVQGLHNVWLEPAGPIANWLGSKPGGRAPNGTRAMCGMNSLQFATAVTKQFGGPNGKPLVFTKTITPASDALVAVKIGKNAGTPTPENQDVLWHDVEYIMKSLQVSGAATSFMTGDGVHPMPWVYFELNMLLLNTIAQHTAAT